MLFNLSSGKKLGCCFISIKQFLKLVLPTNCFAAVAGVYLAERLNRFLGKNWKSFSSQNYFDPSGLFMSVLWSGPLLVISMIILVSIFLHITFSVLVLFLHRILTWSIFLYMQINTLFSLCYLIVRWKRAELRHRARAARNKQD